MGIKASVYERFSEIWAIAPSTENASIASVSFSIFSGTRFDEERRHTHLAEPLSNGFGRELGSVV